MKPKANFLQMLVAPFVLTKVPHHGVANPFAVHLPPPSPQAHTHLHEGVVGHCPASLTGLETECERQCETDEDCDSEEICCTLGCSSACALAVLPARMVPMSVAIVVMMTGAWMLVCCMLNGTGRGGNTD